MLRKLLRRLKMRKLAPKALAIETEETCIASRSTGRTLAS